MTFFTRARLDALKATNKLPAEVWNALATPEEISSTQHKRKKKGCEAHGHALLAEVTYKKPEGAKSLILFVKPAVTGEETLDLLEYSEAHPQFPHESTGDQFFDEAQWECYRKLGQHSGNGLFGALDAAKWFSQLPWISELEKQQGLAAPRSPVRTISTESKEPGYGI